MRLARLNKNFKDAEITAVAHFLKPIAAKKDNQLKPASQSKETLRRGLGGTAGEGRLEKLVEVYTDKFVVVEVGREGAARRPRPELWGS